MNNKIESKISKLNKIVSKYKSSIIAFSGGVDSTCLARLVKEVHTSKLKLITVSFSAIPEFEINDSIDLAKEMNINHEIIKVNESMIPGFLDNESDRCYKCKKYLFSTIQEKAIHGGYEVVFDGTNADDVYDYRPGRLALKELGVISPLGLAGLSKSEIRLISKELRLSTQSKPSYACLASRFPYGEIISKDKLDRVNFSEKDIRNLGFTQFRVRSHDNLARLEFLPDDMEKAWQLRKQIEGICKSKGFLYVAFDTVGYRLGAMNEALEEKEISKFKF